MPPSFMKLAVRTQFFFTGRKSALQSAYRYLKHYRMLADGITAEEGNRSVRVPPMLGVDEDMRNWSFYQIIAHNRIVNQTITSITSQLANGEKLSGLSIIDPKKNVMPPENVNEDEMIVFEQSVTDHIRVVEQLPKLRGTALTPHPIFGPFDAHRWNCMFSLHLKIHIGQASCVARMVKEKKPA